MKDSGASQRDRILRDIDKQMRAWSSWLAEDDGIPVQVQPMFDMSQYDADAREIVEGIRA